jgi:hypothetical protein
VDGAGTAVATGTRFIRIAGAKNRVNRFEQSSAPGDRIAALGRPQCTNSGFQGLKRH